MHNNLGSQVAAIARTHAERPALWAKGESLTYGELLERSGRIARALQERGIGPGDRVAILSERQPTAYVGILGALFAGAAYTPLNIRFPRERNRLIIESSAASALICSDSQAKEIASLLDNSSVKLLILPESDFVASTNVSQISRGQLSKSLEPDLPLPCEIESGQLAYVFYTSGTTGVPKGVPISHDNVFAYLRGIRTITEVGPEDRVMQVVDLTFDLSVHDIFLAWTSGASLISIPENGTLLSSRFVEEHEATHWLSVPSAAALVKQAGLLEQNMMPTLRYSFFCGEALTGAVAESWAAAAPNSQVWNIYGPTEATVAFSACRYIPRQENIPAVVSLGEPFPEQRMGLFTNDGVRANEAVGEICLSGSQVTSGYWNDPDLTAQRFFEAEGCRWYRTGDLGRYIPEEGYAYLGRADRQVKIRGYRVELQEIENSVREATGCDLVAVIPYPVDTSGTALGCVAVSVGGQAGEQAIARCRELLPDYMVPSEIIQIKEMPLNANGKIDHRVVQERVLAGQGVQRPNRHG